MPPPPPTRSPGRPAGGRGFRAGSRGAGRTLPIPAGYGGGLHVFRIGAKLDPAIVTAEGQPVLSLYFGRRSLAAGVLGRDSVVELTRLR